MTFTLRFLAPTELPAYIRPLGRLLQDAVEHGASVGFLPSLAAAQAEAYWHDVAAGVKAGTRALLVAEQAGQVLGTGQLVLATLPNSRHRAEISKLLVYSHAQRRGLGRQLLHTLETYAREHGRTTLVLDTLQGAGSELLYQGAGYTAAGAVPGYARIESGELAATVFYYKLLI